MWECFLFPCSSWMRNQLSICVSNVASLVHKQIPDMVIIIQQIYFYIVKSNILTMRIWSLSARGEKKPSVYLHFKRIYVLAGSTARTINSSGEMCLRSSIGHNTQTAQQKKQKPRRCTNPWTSSYMCPG